MYELIILDADGTLFDYERAESAALERAFQKFQLSYNPELHLKKYKVINSGVWVDFENNKISAENLKTERFQRFFDLFKMEVDIYRFSDTYLGLLSDCVYLLEGAEELLKELYGHYKLIILTNGLKTVQYSRFGKSVLSQYIDNIIVSEEAGSPKPDPYIFEYTFAKINHTSKETAIILGDNLASDIKGGIDFGIDTCWFNPQKTPNRSDIIPKFEIASLGEFTDILKK